MFFIIKMETKKVFCTYIMAKLWIILLTMLPFSISDPNTLSICEGTLKSLECTNGTVISKVNVLINRGGRCQNNPTCKKEKEFQQNCKGKQTCPVLSSYIDKCTKKLRTIRVDRCTCSEIYTGSKQHCTDKLESCGFLHFECKKNETIDKIKLISGDKGCNENDTEINASMNKTVQHKCRGKNNCSFESDDFLFLPREIKIKYICDTESNYQKQLDKSNEDGRKTSTYQKTTTRSTVSTVETAKDSTLTYALSAGGSFLVVVLICIGLTIWRNKSKKKKNKSGQVQTSDKNYHDVWEDDIDTSDINSMIPPTNTKLNANSDGAAEMDGYFSLDRTERNEENTATIESNYEEVDVSDNVLAENLPLNKRKTKDSPDSKAKLLPADVLLDDDANIYSRTVDDVYDVSDHHKQKSCDVDNTYDHV